MLVRTQHQQQRQQMQQRQQQQQQLRQQAAAAAGAAAAQVSANHVPGSMGATVVTTSGIQQQPPATTSATTIGDADSSFSPSNLDSSGEIPSMGDIVTPDEIAEQLSSLANELQEDESTYTDTSLQSNADGDTSPSAHANDAVTAETIGTQLYTDPGGSNSISSPNETLSSIDGDASNGANSWDFNSSGEIEPRDEARSDTSDMVLRCRTTSQPKSNSTPPKPMEDGKSSPSCNDTPSDNS